ncbi:N-6 DNA methylase [Arthrobacter sp. TMN-50]
MLSFDAQMRSIHDHLYSSANIRVPEGLQLEVAKVIQAITWLSVVDALSPLPEQVRALAASGDTEAVTEIARSLRKGFSAYNSAMSRYPRGEAILRLDDKSLAYIRAALSDVDMSDADRDWLGDALEVFRSTAAKRLGGQFFTDQKITNLAVELLNYDPEEHDLVDICAGTGGFLLAGARVARLKGMKGAPRLIGVEVDGSLAHLANSTVRQLGGLPADPVFNADSFRAADQWPVQLRRTVIPGTHMRLATNPPFGQKITVKDPETLRRFDLGHIWSKKSGEWVKSKKVSPTPPDILFVERNVELAVPGEGRLSIVLPYQILSGPKLGYVREWLLRHTKILSVVDLPEDAFQPWTGTKTILLTAERRTKPLDKWEPEDYPVFMSVASEIGHDRRGNPIVDVEGKIVTDLPGIEKDHADYLKAGRSYSGSAKSFVVSANSFTKEADLRLNAAYYMPTRVGARNHFDNLEDSDFEVRTLGEVTRRIFFPGRFKRNYVTNPADGVPFYGGTNITQLRPTNRKYLSNLDRKLPDFLVQEGWVLVTRSGSTGIVSSVPKSWEGHAMSEHVIRIEPDHDLLPGDYIEAYLRGPVGQKLLAQGIFGSVIDEITPEHIASLPIPVPRDKKVLRNISSLQKASNDNRELAIRQSLAADAALEELIGGHFAGIGEYADTTLPSLDVSDKRQKLIES